jgi:signal transduction histidine kinase
MFKVADLKLSFSSKVSLIVVIVVILSIHLYASIEAMIESQRIIQGIIDEKRKVNELVAFSLESAEYQSLTWYKKYIIMKAAEPEDVVYCRLVKPCGEILLSSIEGERGMYILDPAIHANETLVKNDVFNGEKIIVIVSPTYHGYTVWLGFSVAQINAVFMQTYMQAAVMTLIAALILAPTSYFIVSRYLRPVKELTDLCREVGRGNFDVQAIVKSKDEIGLLANTFNNMINDLKRLREEIRRSERLSAIGQLAAMVSHDLRNPLTAIANAVYYLKTKINPSENEKISKMLTIIEEEVKHADKIITDLLDFSRVRKPEFKEVDLTSLVKASLDNVKIPDNIEVKIEVDQIPPIEADLEDLRRVFINIIQNAVQAMPKGGRLTISAKTMGEYIELKFSDTGIGIPKENLEKLFTPLFTTKAKGVGLGLCICKRIIDAHHGTIEVESDVGKGTTFTIKLPIHQNYIKEENQN